MCWICRCIVKIVDWWMRSLPFVTSLWFVLSESCSTLRLKFTMNWAKTTRWLKSTDKENWHRPRTKANYFLHVIYCEKEIFFRLYTILQPKKCAKWDFFSNTVSKLLVSAMLYFENTGLRKGSMRYALQGSGYVCADLYFCVRDSTAGKRRIIMYIHYFNRFNLLNVPKIK